MWGEDIGLVWDGTKSTGPQVGFVPATPSVWLLIGTGYPVTAAQDIHVNWVFTAIDDSGKDVGLTCYQF